MRTVLSKSQTLLSSPGLLSSLSGLYSSCDHVMNNEEGKTP